MGDQPTPSLPDTVIGTRRLLAWQTPLMSLVEAIVGAVVLAFLVITIIGLATGRLDRRAESCCPRDPTRDLRMRTGDEDGTACLRLPDSTHG